MNADVLHDRYRVDHRIAVGSAGAVFAATDLRTEAPVVVKVFPSSGDEVGTGRSDWAREMRLAFRLFHPNIVRCLNAAFGCDDPFLVFERVPGGSLRRALVVEQRLSEDRVRELVRDVAEALHYAHGRGVLHRDIKPENVLRGEDRWLLTDFGSGRFVARGTSAATVIGSLGYMAPECFDQRSEWASDQYGLGVLAWEALHGERPKAEIRCGPPSPDLGPLQALLRRMFAGHPRRRWSSLRTVLRLVEADDARCAEDAEGGDLVLSDKGLWWSRTDEVIWRGPRPKGFVHVPGAVPVLHAGRRMLVIDAGVGSTWYTQDLDFSALSADVDRGLALLRVGSELWRVSPESNAGPVRWSLSDAWIDRLKRHRWSIVDSNSAMGIVEGEQTGLRLRLDGPELTATEHTFRGEVREARSVATTVGFFTESGGMTWWESLPGSTNAPVPFDHTWPVRVGPRVELSFVVPLRLEHLGDE